MKKTVGFIRDDIGAILQELKHIRSLLEDIEKNTRKPYEAPKIGLLG